MKSEQNIAKCNANIREAIKEFCEQKDSKTDNLSNFLESKFGINLNKYNIINSTTLCNPKNEEIIDKICYELCHNEEILFQMF